MTTANPLPRDDVLPDFPMARRCPYAPPAEYVELRAAGPVAPVRFPNGRTGWIVLRHAEARQVLTDPRISTDTSRPDFPRMHDEKPDEELARVHEGMFIDLDPPEHDRYRRMLISEFSVRSVNAMRPGIQRIVDEHIDALEPGADLVADFGLPVPSLVICQLLGVPYADREFFQRRTRTMLDATDLAEIRSAIRDLRDYLDGLVREAEARPGDNLLGRLVTGRRRTGELGHDAMVGMAHLLLIAGHETTANMIPLGVLCLLDHPDQLAGLRADPSGWPAAVEELLRYLSVVDWVAGDRMALEDIEIGGRTIRAGDAVYVLNAAANRDERAFAEPDRLDVRRGARHHLAFGYGVHQCLGQNLARAELEIAYRTLFDRLPGLRPAVEAAELSFRYDAPIFGLAAFPVRW